MKTIYILVIIVAVIIVIYGIYYISIEAYKKQEIKSVEARKKVSFDTRYPILEDLLNYASEKAEENNIKLIPSYGTLLGLIRDQEIIKHDYDIDLFLYEEDWLKFKEIMKENNRYKFKETNVLWHHKYEIYDEKTDIGIDFFRIYKTNNEVKLDVLLSFTNGGVRDGKLEYKSVWRKKFKKDIFEPLEKKNTNYGYLYFPNKSEKLIETWYGKDWKTPR